MLFQEPYTKVNITHL